MSKRTPAQEALKALKQGGMVQVSEEAFVRHIRHRNETVIVRPFIQDLDFKMSVTTWVTDDNKITAVEFVLPGDQSTYFIPAKAAPKPVRLRRVK